MSIELATSAKAVQSLRSYRAELGVVGGFAAAPETESEPLVEDKIVVVGPPQLARRTLSRKHAESMTWISREEGSASRASIEAAWADSGITPSRRLELPSWEAVKLAVSRGDGVAGCSRFAVEGELRTGSLALVRLRGWNVRRTISIIRLRDATSTPSAREFLTMLHAQWGRKPSGRAHRPPDRTPPGDSGWGSDGPHGPAASSDRISYWADHAVREPIGLAVHGAQCVAYERTVAATRVALGEESFAATWAQGKALTTEQAVEYALSAAD